MDRYLETAIADLHAARLHLQDALLAVHRALATGEETADSSLRVINAEFRGTAEEAAVFGVLLDQILRTGTKTTHGEREASARRRAAISPADGARRR